MSAIRKNGEYAPWHPYRIEEEDEGESKELVTMPCDSTVGPEEEKGCDCDLCQGKVKVRVTQCEQHHYVPLEKKYINYDSEEERDVLPPRRFVTLYCIHCKDIEDVEF